MSVQGLLKAVTELTTVSTEPDSILVLTADDPALFRHPIAMLTEPGCWDPTDAEVAALRAYLLKGGFLLVDDPTFGDCSPEHCELAADRFERWMKKVLPQGRVTPLRAVDPIFDGFFRIDPEHLPVVGSEAPQVVGIYRNNDTSKRVMVVCTYRSALGHLWRYVDEGLGSGLEQGGAAYRLGLNYMMYGLSH